MADLIKILADLRQEHDQLGEAIHTIERLAARGGKRRGRPPAWMAALKKPSTTSTERTRKPFSLETRKKMATAQKARWAAKKAS